MNIIFFRMSNFFDLPESKKKGLSVAELHNYAERLEINVYKVSEKTKKNIKKTKHDLIDEIDAVYLKNKIEKTVEKQSAKKSGKIIGKNKPKIVIYFTEEDLINNQELIENRLNKDYLEKKYNLKFNFGSIIYNGKFYLYNKDKSFVLLENIQDNYVKIPRLITKNISNSIQYFSKFKDEKMKIGVIELDRKDDYVNENIEIDKNDKLNGINFNYAYSFLDEKYYFEIELNYLGQKKIINEEFETFKFFPKNDVTLIQLFDFHNKLSLQKFKFSFKIYGPSGNFIDSKSSDKNLSTFWNWQDDIIIEKSSLYEGNKKNNEDSFYECEGYITMYAKFENMKNIKELCSDKLNNEDTDTCYLIRDKEYFKFTEESFDTYIKDIGTDIINFELNK